MPGACVHIKRPGRIGLPGLHTPMGLPNTSRTLGSFSELLSLKRHASPPLGAYRPLL